MLELDREAFEKAIEAKEPVVVDFWAEWCMPCRIFSPVLEGLSDEMDGKATFCKVNIDDCNDLAVKYGVSSIPTVIVFKEGQELDRIVGVVPAERVQAMVEQYL